MNQDKEIEVFLQGKSEDVVSMFWHFIHAYQQIGNITIHPAKTMIGIATTKRIAWVIKLGKNFVDIVFPFTEPYNDNLCFHKIVQVPGSQQFNHHFRMCSIEDINDEVKSFMQLALDKSNTE